MERVNELRQILKKFIKGDCSTEDKKRTFQQLEQQINQFSRGKQAWLLVLQLLLSEDDLQVKYLASNILKDKFKYDYGQLEPEVLIRDVHPAVMKFIAANPRPESGVLFNMSMVMVYLYMQEAEKIGDLLAFLNNSVPDMVNYSFNVLLLLPEEIDNYKVVIEQRKRDYVLEYIRSIQVRVLQRLDVVAKEKWEIWKETGLRREIMLGCFANWVTLGYNKKLMEGLHNHVVLKAALTFIGDSMVSKECENCIITVLKTMRGYNDDKQLFEFIARCCFSYFDVVKKHIAEDLVDLCEPYLNVLAKLGRVAAPLFVSTLDQSSTIFQQNMLYLTLHVGVDNIQQIMRYWKRFCIKLHELKNPTHIQFYRAMLEQLYRVASRIGEYSIKQCQELNVKPAKQIGDEHQDFEDKQNYRNDIDELFDLIGQLVGYDRCVEISLASISQLNVNEDKFQCRFEALLLPLVDIIDEVKQPSSIITTTIERLVELRPKYYCVQRAIIKVLSRCSKIYHNNLHITQLIFKFLVERLQDVRLAEDAASAFENVCDNNTNFVVQNIQDFMQVLTTYRNNEKILHGIAVAVADKPDYLLRYLPELCRSYVEDIVQKKPLTVERVGQMRVSLKRLTEVIHKATRGETNQCSSVITQVFQTVWPIIKDIISEPKVVGLNDKGTDLTDAGHSLLERSCKFIKVCMRSLREKFGPFIDEVFTCIMNAYEKYPIATYVYCVEVVVTVFSELPAYRDALNIIYTKACQITYRHLSQLSKFEANPDLAEDFFGMNTRFMRYAPQIILFSQQLDGLLGLCTMASGVEHRQIANTVYMFVESLYQCFWSEQMIVHFNNQAESEEFKVVIRPECKDGYTILRQKLLANSQVMLMKMVQHFSKAPSQSVRDSIRDAMLAEIFSFPQENKLIWTPILASLEQDILTIEEKQAFVNLLPNICYQNTEDIKELIYVMSKRYLHRKMRAPLS